MQGEPLNIVTFTNSNIEFDKEALEGLLLHPDVKDRKIISLAILGAFRKGKSFFLDYCLRYLYANVSGNFSVSFKNYLTKLSQFKSVKNPTSLINQNDWLGPADAPLRGFSWRSGTRRVTTGIIFWSDVFLYDDPEGVKFAILIADSQGLFDNETSNADNSKIFSLVTLMSSIEILNLQGVIQEDHLQYLQFATEFARFSAKDARQSEKPFQNFIFLIRDWHNPDEFDFGFNGGQSYLDEVLKIKPEHPADIKSVREYLNLSFNDLACALLPYPGKAVASNSAYDGRWSSMDEDFLSELTNLIPTLLSIDNLIVKKVNGFEITGAMANDCFQRYLRLFQSSSVIQPQSIYETTVENFMTSLVNRCYETYKKFVNRSLNEINDEGGIESTYSSAKAAGFACYDQEKKMGTADHVTKYRELLNKKMDGDLIEWKPIVMSRLGRVREEQRRAEEAAREARLLKERIRLQQEEEARVERERVAQVEREAREREAEVARQREDLRQQQLAILAEQERQRVAEEQRLREVAEQQRIQAEIAAAQEARWRQEEENRRRKKKMCNIV